MWNKLLPISAFVLILVLWELTSLALADQRLVLPPPSTIAMRLWQTPGRFFYHTFITFREMLGGFVLAFVLAFPIAWMMDYWKSARRILQPLFILIQCIPMFALAPIMVIWFGWGYAAIVIPTALMIFFPLTMSIYQGFQAIPDHLKDYFRIHQATLWQKLWKLQLPWTKSHIFAGIRISAAIAGIAAVAGEWAGAQAGLGLLMIESRRATDLETTFGALFCLAALSLSLYGLITFLEKRVFNRNVYASLFSAFLICLTILGTGCQTAKDNRQKTRLLLDWLPNPNHIPLFVGIDKGFFEKRGIHLDLMKLQDPSDSLPYLTSGQADLALYYMPDTIRAQNRGVNLQVAGVIFKQPLNCFIYRKDTSIRTPKDLNGKVIGYCVDGNSTMILDHLLESNGITPKEKRNVSFDLVSTLGTKQVDAIYGAYHNVECDHLCSLGVETEFFDLRMFGHPNYYELLVLAAGDSKTVTADVISSFKLALQESIDFSLTHPNEAFEIYVKANPDKSLQTLEWEKRGWEKTFLILARNQDVDQSVWDFYKEWMNQVLQQHSSKIEG